MYAGIERALCGRFQGVGWAMLYDDAIDAKRDRLVDHFGLAHGVLPAVEHPQVCLRLRFKPDRARKSRSDRVPEVDLSVGVPSLLLGPAPRRRHMRKLLPVDVLAWRSPADADRGERLRCMALSVSWTASVATS
jgi:hypothetical protein